MKIKVYENLIRLLEMVASSSEIARPNEVRSHFEIKVFVHLSNYANYSKSMRLQ